MNRSHRVHGVHGVHRARLRLGVPAALVAAVLASPPSIRGADDLPDVIVTDLDMLWAFSGDGDGGFEASPEPLPIQACDGSTCVEPWAVATGDIDGDGLDDVVAANRFGPHVSVHRGLGEGAFAPAEILPTSDRPYDVDLGDLDGDGDLDLAITSNNGSGPVDLRLNDGAGIFAESRPIFIDGEPFNSALADVDADGDVDIALSRNSTDEVIVFLNTGEAQFIIGAVFAANDDPKALAMGNFDDDEILDIVVMNDAAGEVSVFFGDGEGGFASGRAYPTGGQPREVVVVDLDQDGFDDFVVATGRGTSHVSTFLNQGAGGNGVFDGPFNRATGPRPNSVASADFDADGDPDIVVANWSLDDPPLATLSLLLNDGEGSFPDKRDFVAPGGFRKLTALAVGSFGRSAFAFRRGDANLDGSVNIADPVTVLRFLFSGGALDCLDPADADDSGGVGITDAIYLLGFLFQQGAAPLPPFPEPGADPSADTLACRPRD